LISAGSHPRPCWGAYSAPPGHLALAGFKGPTSKGREGRKDETRGKGKGVGKGLTSKARGREEEGGKRRGGLALQT